MSATARAAHGGVILDVSVPRMRLSVREARELADALVEAAAAAEQRPLSGAEAVAEVTGGAQ